MSAAIGVAALVLLVIAALGFVGACLYLLIQGLKGAVAEARGESTPLNFILKYLAVWLAAVGFWVLAVLAGAMGVYWGDWSAWWPR
jgi:hypothetical protein